MLRTLVSQWDGLDAIRAEMLAKLAEVGNNTPDVEELRDHLYVLGFSGDGYVFDELLRMVNPQLHEEPQHIEIGLVPFLRDPYVRAEFFIALGYLGQSFYDRDSDRIKQLCILLRRGLRDEFPEVKIASAIALSRCVKMNKASMEHVTDAVPAVGELLLDPSWHVKRAAVAALMEIPDPRSVRALKFFSERERDPHLQRFAENALKRVKDRASYFRFVGNPINTLRDFLPGRG